VPQHDALMELLTAREHLQLFGRIKGEYRVIGAGAPAALRTH